MTDSPMKRAGGPFADLPRCLARNRRGGLCQRVAGPKRRCHLHGGAYGSGGPEGPQNGQYRHGRCTNFAIAKRRAVRQLLRDLRIVLAAAMSPDERLVADGRLAIDPALTAHRAAAIEAALAALLPVARADAIRRLIGAP